MHICKIVNQCWVCCTRGCERSSLVCSQHTALCNALLLALLHAWSRTCPPQRRQQSLAQGLTSSFSLKRGTQLFLGYTITNVTPINDYKHLTSCSVSILKHPGEKGLVGFSDCRSSWEKHQHPDTASPILCHRALTYDASASHLALEIAV